jgi:hypothetical protein
MNASAVDSQKAVPASLALLAIYNPTLAATEDALEDQIVYYYSRDSQKKGDGGSDGAKDDEHERQRQIGLAQAMVSFAK